MDKDTEELLNETLRKMGRNLLNYQIVEGIWKAQYIFSETQSTIENGETIIKKREITRNTPMGWLSENHRKTIFSSPKETEVEEDIESVSIKTSFHFSKGGDLSKKRKKQVVELVRERNALVHSSLGKFDHKTGLGCAEFCALLDEQNNRVIEEIKFLNQISMTFKEASQVLQKFLESEEFFRSIEESLKGDSSS